MIVNNLKKTLSKLKSLKRRLKKKTKNIINFNRIILTFRIKFTEKMLRVDAKAIPVDKEEVRLFIAGINGAHFIPFLLKHYFDIGINRVFYIDNNSSDNSIEILKKYDNVHIWLQKNKFHPVRNKSSMLWREKLLHKYGVGNWCLLADTDELFIYPNYETRSIREFLNEVEKKGSDCVEARLIDMYSNKKIKDTFVKNSLLETCPYFDKNEYGCRDRVLGYKPYYKKKPLMQYRKNMKLYGGFHNIHGNKNQFDIKCGILHFKFISNLTDFIKKHGDSMNNYIYKNKLYSELDDVNFYNKDISVRYRGSIDLEFFKRYDYKGNFLEKLMFDRSKKRQP